MSHEVQCMCTIASRGYSPGETCARIFHASSALLTLDVPTDRFLHKMRESGKTFILQRTKANAKLCVSMFVSQSPTKALITKNRGGP